MTPWLAHAYTGLGAAVALAATLDVIQGDYRGAFLWLGLQIIIDATDGLLARALRVKELLPDFVTTLTKPAPLRPNSAAAPSATTTIS